MQLQNSFIRSIALTGLAIAGISGCAAGGLGMFPTGSPQGEATLGDAGGGLAGAVAQLRRIVAGDVVEDLYLSWQDRPYDRATIAVAMRTTRALAQDLALRQHDAGQIPSGQRQQALAWVQNAISHLGQNKSQPPPDAFGIDWKRWLTETDTQKESPSAIFAFIDRTSIDTQADSFGDFDLVVSTGQPIYPLAPRRGSIDLPSLAQYASSLDVGLVRLSGSGGAVGDGVEVKSRTLREMMTQPGRLTKSTAVLDAPADESWGAMLARRALFRGASGVANCNAIGISIPPGERTSLAARTRATMWVQALDGQRLGLVEGWRDLQDGQSRLADPDWLEAVAHTSLELRQHSRLIAPFVGQRKMGVLVDVSALDQRSPNAWSGGFADLADALLDQQVPFDVVPKSVAGSAQSYPYKMRYKPGPDFSPTKAAEEASRLLSEREPSLREIIVTDSAGKLADRLYVRQAADASGWAIVNLTGETRRLKLRKGSGKGNAGVFKDQLTGQTVRGSLLMKPYAVRVLSVK